MDDAVGSIEDRIFKFLLSRGVSPGEALSLAKQELARRAQDTIRNQEFARQNPGSLSSESASDPSLPGSDPTAGPVQGSVERPQASTPLTNAQIDEMRITRPMVKDTRPGWVQNREQPQQSIRSSIQKLIRGPSEEEQRIAQEHPRTLQQTYQPAGGSGTPSNQNIVDRALSAVMGSAPPSGASAATPTTPSGQQASASPAPNLGLPMADLPAALSGLSPPSAPAQRPSGGGGGGGGSSAPAAPPAARTSPFDEYNKSMSDEGGGSAHLFARALEEERKRASGGAANSHAGKPASGRDAALHKALEIIQNLLMHRR